MIKVPAQQCQLRHYLGDLAFSLPEGEQSFLFESRVFPSLPNTLQTPNIGGANHSILLVILAVSMY